MYKYASNRGKGLIFYTFFECLEELRGKEVVSVTRQSLPAEVAGPLQSGAIVQNGWYPLSWYRALHAAMQDATGEGAKMSWEIGRLSSEHDLTSGIYRVLIRVFSPQFMVSRGSRLFSKYYEHGQMKVDATGNHRAVAAFTGCAGFNRALWYDVVGGTEGAMKVCGARNLEIRILSGGGDGDTDTVIEGKWE